MFNFFIYFMIKLFFKIKKKNGCIHQAQICLGDMKIQAFIQQIKPKSNLIIFRYPKVN